MNAKRGHKPHRQDKLERYLDCGTALLGDDPDRCAGWDLHTLESPTAGVPSRLSRAGGCNDHGNVILAPIFERCGDELVASSLRARSFSKEGCDVLVSNHVSQSIGAQ